MEDWKQRFAMLRFQPSELGGMQGGIEEIKVTAIEHPLNGLCLTANHYDRRSVSAFSRCSYQLIRTFQELRRRCFTSII